MKKELILLAVCATVWCCSKDDEDEAKFSPDGKKLVAKIHCEDIGEEIEYDNFTFEYDKSGNIEKVIEKEDNDTYTVVFNRSDDRITVEYSDKYVEDGKVETDNGTTVYMLNDKGYVASCRTEWEKDYYNAYSYSYNDKGQLIKSVSEESEGSYYSKITYEYGWANGNLVSRKRVGSSFDNSDYTYTAEENKANIDFGVFLWNIGTDDWLELFGYLGKTNKNFISRDDSYTYKYTFDSEGYITKMEVYTSSNSEPRYIYTVEYK